MSSREDIYRMFSWYKKNIISIVKIRCLRKIIIIGIVSIFVAEWQMGYVWGGIYQRQQHCFLEFKWRPFSLWSDPSNLKSLLTKEVAITILLRQPSKLLLIGEPLRHSTLWNHWKKTKHPLLWNIYVDKLIPCFEQDWQLRPWTKNQGWQQRPVSVLASFYYSAP